MHVHVHATLITNISNLYFERTVSFSMFNLYLQHLQLLYYLMTLTQLKRVIRKRREDQQVEIKPDLIKQKNKYQYKMYRRILPSKRPSVTISRKALLKRRKKSHVKKNQSRKRNQEAPFFSSDFPRYIECDQMVSDTSICEYN